MWLTLAQPPGSQINKSSWTEIRKIWGSHPAHFFEQAAAACYSLARMWLQSSHLKVHLRGFKKNNNWSRWSRSDLVTFCPYRCFSIGKKRDNQQCQTINFCEDPAGGNFERSVYQGVLSEQSDLQLRRECLGLRENTRTKVLIWKVRIHQQRWFDHFVAKLMRLL